MMPHHHQQQQAAQVAGEGSTGGGPMAGQQRAMPPWHQRTAGSSTGEAGGSSGGRGGLGVPSRANTTLVKVSGTVFEVDRKYSFIRPIGSGAYGVVISATNSESGGKVAIKKIPRAFDDLVDAKRILREIKLLRHFHHENIISLVDLLPPASLPGFEDVYIVSDLMETDLHRIIYSKQALSIDHIQYFIYQVLRALKYMHSAGVLHRDLKPSNLLLNSNCDLKVCDFGLARGLAPPGEEDESGGQPGKGLTEYVVTRWYRAPEIMLACQDYGKAIDIWSLGCIFGELLARQPLFPGNDYIDQLRLICAKLGRPGEEDLVHVTSARAKRFIMGLPATPPTPLSALFPEQDARALDLLSSMLQFNPAKRISAVEALRHPFMESLHNEEDEPVCDRPFSFEHEREDLHDKARLQYLILLEVLHFHPDHAAHLKPLHPPPARPLHPNTTTTTPASQPQAASAASTTSSSSGGLMTMMPPPAATTAAGLLPSTGVLPPFTSGPPQFGGNNGSSSGGSLLGGGAALMGGGSAGAAMDVAGSTPVSSHHHHQQLHQQQQQQAAMMMMMMAGNNSVGLGGQAAAPQVVGSSNNPFSTQATFGGGGLLPQQQEQFGDANNYKGGSSNGSEQQQMMAI